MMSGARRACRGLTLRLGVAALALAFPVAGLAVEPPVAAAAPSPEFKVEQLVGQVVWLAEAQRDALGIQSVPEAAERVLALKTDRGQLVPLVEDVRGRAFRRDSRLRGVRLELTVRRRQESAFVQVIGVVGFDGDQRVEIDYWCEVCAIAMYELKDCECCQGPIELRRRPVK